MSMEHGDSLGFEKSIGVRSRFDRGKSAEQHKHKSLSKMPSRNVKITTCVILATLMIIGVALSLIFVLVRSKSSIQAQAAEECLDLTSNLICSRANAYPFYGTKTDYLIAKQALKETGTSSNRNDCVPKQLYLFSRHAARYPDADKIEDMMDKLPKLKNRILEAKSNDPICEKFREDLRDWTITMKPSDDNSLTEVGKLQSQYLGTRLQSKYPGLLPDVYKKESYEMGFTSRERTKETAEAFAKGIFQQVPDLSKFPARDDILQFHKTCEDILKKKGWTKDKHPEIKKFQKGETMDKIVKDMSQRLGIELDFDTLKLMFSICQFEYSIMGESVWCPLFKTGHVKAFEYADDIDDFYEDAYGRTRNYEQACPVVEDLIQKFGSVVNGSGSNPSAILMFSHAGAVKKVISRFGMFEDESPLTADGFCTASDRQWRSSLICPFNANLLFILSSCSGEYFVQAFLQEKAVVLKGCPSSLCPWSTFESQYHKIAEDCDLDKICVP